MLQFISTLTPQRLNQTCLEMQHEVKSSNESGLDLWPVKTLLSPPYYVPKFGLTQNLG